MVFVVISDKYFDCELCSLEFPSRQDRIHHTATHFKSKSCQTCHKLLLCINGDWYELHATPACNLGDDSQHNSCEAISTMKNEIKDNFVSVSKQENDISDSDGMDDDYNAFDSSPIHEPQIEVKTLPPIVQSLAKLKTNHEITISRTKVKRRPAVQIPDISAWKVQKIIKPAKPIKPIIKKPLPNKTVFMDHRPLGNCFCDVCNKTLANFSTLRNHILHQHCSRGRRSRVSCNECDQTFSTPGNLKLHSRIHLKCKAFVCTYEMDSVSFAFRQQME